MWTQINQAWSNLAPRERQILGVLAVFLGVILLYQLIWLPLQTRHQQAQMAAQKAQADWLWLNEQAPNVVQNVVQTTQKSNSAGRSGALMFNTKTALMDSVSQSLRVQNLLRATQGVELTSQGVKVRFAQVDAPRLLAWLSELEQNGLVASRMELSPISPGITQAELQFDVQGGA